MDSKLKDIRKQQKELIRRKASLNSSIARIKVLSKAQVLIRRKALLIRRKALLIENYIKSTGVTDQRVLNAFLKIPRHMFVSAKYRQDAYSDIPLSIGEGQTISQPSLVAVMTQALELKGHEKVLEVGTGSGFQAAILSQLAKKVYTIEFIGLLADQAARILKKLHCDNVHIEIGDGSQGFPVFAPYDAIIVTAAGNQIPQPLVDQLKVGGRIVIPVGDSLYGQQLKVGRKVGNTIKFIDIEPVAFVPLRGKFGVSENFGKLQKVQNKQDVAYV